MNQGNTVKVESDLARVDAVSDLDAVLLRDGVWVHRSCQSCLPVFTLLTIVKDSSIEGPLITLLRPKSYYLKQICLPRDASADIRDSMIEVKELNPSLQLTGLHVR